MALSIPYAIPTGVKASNVMVDAIMSFLAGEARGIDGITNDGVTMTVVVDGDDPLVDQAGLDAAVAAAWKPLDAQVFTEMNVMTEEVSLTSLTGDVVRTIRGKAAFYDANAFVHVKIDAMTTAATLSLTVIEEYDTESGTESNVIGSLTFPDTSGAWKMFEMNTSTIQSIVDEVPVESRYIFTLSNSSIISASARGMSAYLVKIY